MYLYFIIINLLNFKKLIFMKKFFLFFCFMSICFDTYSQSKVPNSEPSWDSTELEGLKDFGFYFSKTDSIQNRIDTFKSDVVQSRTLNDDIIIEEKSCLINFFGNENLLVLNSDSNIDKKFLFLKFLYEEGTPYYCTRHFLSDKGERVVIEYKVKNTLERTIFYISIYSNEKNDYLVTYFD